MFLNLSSSDFTLKVKNSVGKPIDKICPNNFHSYSSNHCAHYVSHMLKLSHSFNCKDYKGGKSEGANIRVQEIFPECPKVGKFEDIPNGNPHLVFITRKNNVDLANKTMRNVPKKHVGIYIEGSIYHYSNSRERVIIQKPADFKRVFEKAYQQPLGMFYGTLPYSDLVFEMDQNPEEKISFDLTKKGNKWYGRRSDIEAEEFYIGREIKDSNRGYYGIYQRPSEFYGKKYSAEDYVDTIDHWAYLLEATGYCESMNYFSTFNTYDRAKFTYGFYQLAAHTPNDNLILLFRKMTELSKFKRYFPELKLIDGNLHRIKEDGSNTNLERIFRVNNKKQLQYFMNFLNPYRKSIDQQEILHIAKLMDWTQRDKKVRLTQVELASEILQRKMSKWYSRWYDLHGQSDIICTVIADIHHQGRAKRVKVLEALKNQDPVNALINIRPKYKSRIKNLNKILNQLKDEGKLGHKIYDAALNEFVDP